MIYNPNPTSTLDSHGPKQGWPPGRSRASQLTILHKRRDRKGNGREKAKKPDEYRSDPIVDKAAMINDRFFSYYKAQSIVPENEWDEFVDALRTHLPTTFRVAGSRKTALTLNGIIQSKHVPTLTDVEFEGQKIPPPVQIPWSVYLFLRLYYTSSVTGILQDLLGISTSRRRCCANSPSSELSTLFSSVKQTLAISLVKKQCP